jgi:hypothetical protein
VAVLAVFEIIINALPLAQPGDEVQGGLAVLHAVFAGRIVVKALEGVESPVKFCSLSTCSMIWRYGHVLEDAEVRDQLRNHMRGTRTQR